MLLYLLRQNPEGGRGSVEIDGLPWKRAAQDLDASQAEDIAFTCVSYTWGAGREGSPFDPSFDVSDRTIPALNAVVSHRPSCACIWIDAFCVSTETLESKGFIYSRADEVIVVLPNAARPVLERMNTSDSVDPVHLDVLEREEWVSRAWTYQEVVNSWTLSITCVDSRGAIVHGSRFLNCLSYNLSRLDGSGLANDRMRRYPRLDALEDVIADYMTAVYQERSALRVMSSMDRRTQRHREDHFYAMIGAISTARASSCQTPDPREAFMLLCEKKGDYSFIYSAAKRDSTQSRRWRPVSGDLPPILPWHCFGEGQSAHEDSGSLYLDLMLLLENRPIDEDVKKFVEGWLTLNKIRAARPLDLFRSQSTSLFE